VQRIAIPLIHTKEALEQLVVEDLELLERQDERRKEMTRTCRILITKEGCKMSRKKRERRTH